MHAVAYEKTKKAILPNVAFDSKLVEEIKRYFFLEFTAVPTHFFIRGQEWDDLVRDDKLSAQFDPTINSEVLKKGLLGTIYGISLTTDVYDDIRQTYDFDIQAYNELERVALNIWYRCQDAPV